MRTALDACFPIPTKTRILVLGTPHLKELGSRFKPHLLDNLLSVLKGFAPKIIAVESIPPDVLDHMVQTKAFMPVVENLAHDRVAVGQQVAATLSISSEDAKDKARRMLAQMECDQGQGLKAASIPYLLASYDDLTAALHWSYLKQGDTNQISITAETVYYLDQLVKSPNERSSIGIRIARELGIEKIEYIDDHQDKDMFLSILPQLEGELNDNDEYCRGDYNVFYGEARHKFIAAAEAGELLSHYRYINSDAYSSRDIEEQWGLWFRTNLNSGLDRARVALWEVRNLNMASHIRRVTAMSPGANALVVVGAAHKPFLDCYLRQMLDIEVVDLESLL